MKKLTLIISVLITCFITSCKQEEITDSSGLVNTKWTTSDRDFSIGDDWVGEQYEVYHLYFYSSNECCLYYSHKSSYSDVGTSKKRYTAFFNYTTDGNVIRLDSITEGLNGWGVLKIDGERLSADGLSFTKGTYSSTDKEWLSTIHGTTGRCSWYTNLCGDLWVVGDGAMADYSSFESTPWAKNDRVVYQVFVKDGVTSVGSYSFANPLIDSVMMPDESMENIGDAAFKDSGITYIWLSEGVTNVGDEAFANCKQLSEINIPKMLVTIGDWAFSDTAIKQSRLAFGKALRSIGKFAFSGSKISISDITFEEGVTTIGAGAFLGGSICNTSRELVLPNSLTSLGTNAFEGPLKKIVIGSGLAEIGTAAFVTAVTSGDVYVNRGTPPSVEGNLIVGGSNWTARESGYMLYVPTGSKSAYASQFPWSKFKSTNVDNTLEGGTGDTDSGDTDGGIDAEYSDRSQDEQDADSDNRGPVAEGFHGGSGTASDPYQIATAAELRYFSDAVRGGNLFRDQYVKLTADIVINKNVLDRYGELNGDGRGFEPWIPIGRYDPSYFFCGTFDGGGHYVSGLYCNRPEGSHIGFFGKLYGNVKNLEIRDSYFRGNAEAGGIAGSTAENYNASTIPASVKEYYKNSGKQLIVYNCKNNATVIGLDSHTGGILGRANNCHSLSKCINSGIVISYNSKTGGIAGGTGGESKSNQCTISDCCNMAEIVGDISAGGILGYGVSYVSIVNSLNIGRIAGKSSVGGICGTLKYPYNYIKNCVNANTVIEAESAGAILGSCSASGSKLTEVKGNYYLYKETLPAVGQKTGGSVANNHSLTESEMNSQDTVDKLNSSKSKDWCSWKLGSKGYPILEWME